MKKIIFILFISLLSAAPTLAEFDLDSLFKVSVGGEEGYQRLKNLTSYHAEGEISLNGMVGRISQFFVPPNKYYMEINFGDFRLVQAYDGETAWQMDQNGFVSEMHGYEKINLLSNIYFESFSYMFPSRIEGSYQYRGHTYKNTVPCHEVVFYPLNEDTVTIYYYIPSGLSKFMSGRLDNVTMLTTVDDYRDVSGVKLPFYSRAEAESVNLYTEIKVDSVRFDEPFDTVIFSKPLSGETDFRFPGEDSLVTIPMDYRQGHIYIKASINGVMSAWFILDSGASGNILNESAVAELNLPVAGELPAKGIGGYDKVDLLKTDSISIGRLTLYNQVAGATDLSGIGKAGTDGLPFGGVLGYDFLSRFPVMINFQKSVITVFNPETFEPPEEGAVIDFHLIMQVPTIEAELNSNPGNFIIDLGNPFGLILHDNFVRANDLLEKLDDIKDIDRGYAGVGGAVGGKTAYAAVFKIGDIMIRSLRVILPEESDGLSGSEEIDGNIGNLLLENFRVLFDYSRNRVILYDTGT